MLPNIILISALFFLSDATTTTETVLTDEVCDSTAATPVCTTHTDAVCDVSNFCAGPATCNADCNSGPDCPGGGTCWALYDGSGSKCCTWLGNTGGGSSTTSAYGTSCIDLAASGRPSDCPANKNLCEDPLYKNLMTQQCPKTCGICTPGSTTSNSTNCLDKAAAGQPSDCPSRSHLCDDTLYRDLMTQQCPKTCARCPSG